MRHLLVFPTLVILSSCSSNSDGSSTLGMKGSAAWHKWAPIEEKIAYYAPLCEAYGFEKGSTAFSNCVAQEVRNGRNSSKARADALSKSIGDAFDNSTSVPSKSSDKVRDYSDVICTNGRVMTQYGCRYR